MLKYSPLVEGASPQTPIVTSTGEVATPGGVTPSYVLPGAKALSPITAVGAADATNHMQSVIAPTIAEGTKDMTTQSTKLAADALAKSTAPVQTQQQKDEASGYHNTYGYGVDGSRIVNPNLKPGETDESSPELKAITNTPEAGYKFAYQSDGTRVEIPVSSTPEQYGLSETKPGSTASLQAMGGVNNSAPLDDGNQVAQLGNGSYAKLDGQGNFAGTISQDEFNAARNGSNKYQMNLERIASGEIQEKMTRIENGSYPLKSWQQDQLNNVKAQYAELIAKQTISNNNFEGGTRVLQGLLGMSEYSPGVAMGEVKAAIDQGISKIAALNSELAGTLGKMTSAFQQNNFDMLKVLYTQHADNVEKRQAAIDKITAATAKAFEDQRNYDRDIANDKAEKEYKDATLEIQRETLTYNEKKDKLNNLLQHAQLDETKRHNLATELEAMRKRQQEAMGEHFDPNTPFASTIATVSRSVNRLDRSNFMKQVSASAKRGDWKTMLTDIKNEVNAGLPAADRTKLNAHENSISYLNNMENLLRQYEALGGDTGILKGKFQDVSTKLGLLATDPEFASLATAMNENFVRFRAEVTGAAFSPAESAGYQALVPAGDKSVDLNLAVISGARMYAEQQANATYQQKMGKGGYENLSGLVQSEDSIQRYVNNATPEDQQRVAQMVQDKVPYNEIIKFFGIEE